MIKIITDSAADITQEEKNKLGITILPLRVRFNEEEYEDGLTITNQKFYEKLIESDTLPKTSQVSPGEFEAEYQKVDPSDEAIVITLSKELSGTYQSASKMAEDHDNIYVVDSLSATVGERLVVYRAIELVKEGKLSAKEIKTVLENEIPRLRVVALVDTLEYLKKGGRISATTAFFGEMLNIKPVIEVQNGKVVSTGKARGSKNGNNKLRSAIDNYGGIDFSKPFATAYSGLTDVMLLKYIEDSKDIYGDREVEHHQIGSVIGTHVGPGAVAVAFYSNK